MKTKLLCVLLAMMLVLAMFAACDNGSGDSGNGDAGNTDGGNTNTGNNGDDLNDLIVAPTYNTDWNNTPILISLTDDDAAGELESGCAQYYAGTASNKFSELDDLIRSRNMAAAKAANVTPDFKYTFANNGWGQNSSVINDLVLANNSANPDIFCNYVYDMAVSQLSNSFKNLLSKKESNYFKFASDPNYVKNLEANRKSYFDSSVGEGYYYEYMKSLTLSDDKMYLLASDYCTDLVRSFLVVPLNVDMMQGITMDRSWTGDMTEVSDFYALVWKSEDRVQENAKYNEGWTYDVMAFYADKIYNDANDNGSQSALADVVGFAAGCTSGLVSSGFLYTTSVKIIDKIKNDDGSYTYDYPENNPELDVFGKAITKLFNSKGIITVKNTEDEVGEFRNSNETELIAIRNRFAQNKILFGGIIAVGSLEHESYQNMRTNGSGFGVLPVPTYKTGEEYLTLVHNIAKVIAIAKSSAKFSECSAYLDCLSRTSAPILEEYYGVQLASKTGGLAGEYNKHMLVYIRNHVRDCFDKTFEDAVSVKLSADLGQDQVTNTKWHEILGGINRFKYESFASDYQANASLKEGKLDGIYQDWLRAE